MNLQTIFAVGLLSVALCAYGERPLPRVLLGNHVNEIQGSRQNLLQKKELATELCDALLALDKPTVEDAPLLVKYITLADPRMLDGRLRTPPEVFPAVQKLIEIGPEAVTATVDSIAGDQVNPQQLAINVAYVLTKTIGREKALVALENSSTSNQSSRSEQDVVGKAWSILQSSAEPQ